MLGVLALEIVALLLQLPDRFVALGDQCLQPLAFRDGGH